MTASLLSLLVSSALATGGLTAAPVAGQAESSATAVSPLPREAAPPPGPEPAAQPAPAPLAEPAPQASTAPAALEASTAPAAAAPSAPAGLDLPPEGSEDPPPGEDGRPEAPESDQAGPDEFAPSFIDPAAAAAPAQAPAVPKPAAGPGPERKPKASAKPVEEEPVEPVVLPAGFQPLRGVHLSAWVAGTPKSRRKFLDRAQGTFINAVVVPLKETDGQVYIPGVAKSKEYGTFLPALPDPEGLVADVHSRGLKAIARIVIFKDNLLARRKPEWAVRRPDGSLWRNRKGVTWVDPYRREIWDYNLDLAFAAARAGFDEIQFDYIRFPSDGDIRTCRYSRADHTNKLAHETVREFLRYARTKLASTKLPLSVAVFGMVTSTNMDMGIGQDLRAMAESSDYISPMMYPSHYYRGEYGLANPNREPYKVIHRGLRDAKKRLGRESSWKLRPYLQDFSLGYRYGVPEVEAQLLAAQKQGIDSFILWNPANLYTWKALEVRNDARVRYPASAQAPFR